MIRVPAAWACGSQAAISACAPIVVGLAASQLIETRFTFRPTSLSVAKNEAPPSPVLPASSVTPDVQPGSRGSCGRAREHGARAQQ